MSETGEKVCGTCGGGDPDALAALREVERTARALVGGRLEPGDIKEGVSETSWLHKMEALKAALRLAEATTEGRVLMTEPAETEEKVCRTCKGEGEYWIGEDQFDVVGPLDCEDCDGTGRMSDWRRYRRTGHSEMRPYVPGEDLSGVSVSDQNDPETDMGMIARNPENHADQWYVAREYFEQNFEPEE